MKNILKLFWFILIIAIGAIFIRVLSLRSEERKAHIEFPVRVQCRRFEESARLYHEKYGFYPDEKNGLQTLLSDVDCRQLIKETNLTDPWGTPFKYRLSNGIPMVESAGQNRKFGDFDDIHSY